MFQRRACPLCNSSSHSQVLRLTAEEIVRANWTYRGEMLGSFHGEIPNAFDIVQCDDCAFVFAGLLPSNDFLEIIYDQVIDVDAARRESYRPRNIARRMSDLSVLLILIGDGGSVLDYGCGFGSTLGLLRSVQGVRCVGFDTSGARVGELRRLIPSATVDLCEIQAQAPYSAIILDNVLEHVKDPRETVRSIRQLCAPGAILYVSVPDVGQRYLRQQIACKGRSGLMAMDINPWEHLNYFDVAHLDRLMAETGFLAIRQCELPEEPRIGLRPNTRAALRFRNTMASFLRATRYAFTGDALKTGQRRFYRLREA